MNEASIRKFLAALGMDESYISLGNGWVNCVCPTAHITHAAGIDTRPSFGISINDEAQSVYYCFGCQSEGRTLDWLIHTLFVGDKIYPWEAAEVFIRDEIHNDPDKIIITPHLWELPVSGEPQPLSETIYGKYPLLHGHDDEHAEKSLEYLSTKRGVSPWIAYMCRVRYNPENKSLIFPLKDLKGHIYVLRERVRFSKNMWTVSPKSSGFLDLEFPTIKESGAMFFNDMTDWRKPLMVVEAEMEAMHIMELKFFNVAATATSSITLTQIMNMAKARTLYLGFDDDEAGRKAENKVISVLGPTHNLYKLRWSVANGCKDPGEIKNREELNKVLEEKERVENRY